MEGVPASIQTAASGLRAKRRALSKGISEYIKSINDGDVPTLESFMTKRDQFESEWNECIKANENCLSLLNPDSDEEKKKVEDLNDALDAVREKKEMLEFYES